MASIARWKSHVKSDLLNNPVVSRALSANTIDRYCHDVGHQWRDTFWSPTTTIATFLLQVLDGAKTLRAAVALLLVQVGVWGEANPPSGDPSAYCQARRRLPFELVTNLLQHVARTMHRLVTADSHWQGHRVWLVDGSSVSMPDTPQLQGAFPQPSVQTPGCGFPVARIVALFCWATGAVMELAIDNLMVHELSLFRRLWHCFAPGDVVVGDRLYSSYVDVARLRGRGVHTLSRLHQQRKADFRQGRRLGHDDRLVIWERPRQWLASCGVDRMVFECLPATMPVRLVRITEIPKGFRSRTIVVVTTLIDPIETPAEEIRALYRDRWMAELNLRSIKTHLGMEVLGGQSVDVVRKEIAMHLLAYNLIRLVMWHAAHAHGRDLHRLSFTGTLHRFRAVAPWLIFDVRASRLRRLVAHLLRCVAADQVPERPNRTEPRRVKRRPKPYGLLVEPRIWYRHHVDPRRR